MTFVFDTSSFSKLKHFYPEIFPTLWDKLDTLVQSNLLISTREVFKELEQGVPDQHVNDWLKERKELFKTPSTEELAFVQKIFKVKHFQQLIGEQQRLKGTPVADPFLIALASVQNATIVTEEKGKKNAAKIPNVCEHFGNIPCIDLALFMQGQSWQF